MAGVGVIELLIINMGATAIGTGITAEPGYAEACTQFLKEITGWKIKLADNLIEATHDTSPMVSYSSALKMIAIRLSNKTYVFRSQNRSR
jgi:aspartate ammonia-lyase